MSTMDIETSLSSQYITVKNVIMDIETSLSHQYNTVKHVNPGHWDIPFASVHYSEACQPWTLRHPFLLSTLQWSMSSLDIETSLSPQYITGEHVIPGHWDIPFSSIHYSGACHPWTLRLPFLLNTLQWRIPLRWQLDPYYLSRLIVMDNHTWYSYIMYIGMSETDRAYGCLRLIRPHYYFYYMSGFAST